MAETFDDLARALLEEHYGSEPKAGTSGGWDAPPEAKSGWDVGAYLRSLPSRAVDRMGSQYELWQEENRRKRDLGLKEQLRDEYGVGHLVNAYDALTEGRYLPAAGHATLGIADLAAPARSKAASAADAALQAWDAALKARPGQLAERAAEELQKLLPKGRYKTDSAAHAWRVDNSNRAAERAIPEPLAPNGYTTEAAQKALGSLNRTWPSNVAAGTFATAGASGIPSVVLDDIKGTTIDPLNAMRKDMADEWRAEKEQRAMSITPGGEPEVKHYWEPVDRLRHERNVHAGFAGGMGAAGGPTVYAAGKSIPWAASRAAPSFLGLAADAAMVHPLLGLPIAAAALAPFAVPAALGWGGWELAKGTAGQIDQATQKHAEAGERARIVRKILENYRDQPGAPSLTPDQSY